MYFIVFAALCSVAVSIWLKHCKHQQVDVLQMLAWNYLLAMLLCYVWFKPDFSHVSVADTPWWVITLLGVALPSIFLMLGGALTRAGVIKTEIAQRLSVVLSLSAAYLFFQEQFTALKGVGIALGLLAMLCILLSRSGEKLAAFRSAKRSQAAMWSLFAVWVGYAVVDILLKYTSGLGLQFALTLNLSFIVAFIFMSAILIFRKTQWSMRALYSGLLLGLLNFSNIALYIKAHQWLKDSPSVVFAGMNILVVLLGVIAGMIIFKERLNKLSSAAIVFAAAAIFVLAKAL
ncbi:EamA family transporter [Acinetobacter rudis]|uniref:EamA domain-containing protein n=1 Tax=Acinetobacter rudis CIP 110305 TaxID=421052 RepID=S3MUE5_9GAMM|nr:EamA family transporter [Acinetobacter rudis]EPF71375.1 hypothetical protein F945_02404 [Acinetobacter rudis CIP 110305]